MLQKIKSFLFENKSYKQTIIKNYFWLGFAELMSKGINILLPILIVRFIGIREFGMYSFAFSIGIIFYVLSDFGFTQLFIKEIAKKQDRNNILNIFPKFFTIKVFLSFLNIFLFFILFILLPNNDNTILIILLGLVYISNGFIEFARGIFRGIEKIEFEALIRGFYGFIIFLLLIPYIVYLHINIIELSFVYFVINIFFSFGLFYILYTKNIVDYFFINVSRKEFLQYLNNSYPFALSIVIVMLYYYIDTIILKFYVDFEQIGIYSAAYRIILILIAPISILVNLLFPVFSKLYHKNKDRFSKIVNKFFLLVFFVSLLIFPFSIYFSGFISYIFYGDILKGYDILVKILFSSVFFLYLGSIFGVSLLSSGNQKKYMQISLFGLIINIALNFILIPIYGLNGAAIATLITEILIFFGYFYSFKLVNFY